MKRRVETGSEVVLLSSILGPNSFLQPENVRDPKESPLFQIITMEIIKYFAQGAYIQVQAIAVYILKNGNKEWSCKLFQWWINIVMEFRHTYHRVRSVLSSKMMVMKIVMFTYYEVLDLHMTAKQLWIKRFRKTILFPTLTHPNLN